MNAWTEWRATYKPADVSAFGDAKRIDAHFGLPLPNTDRVFSLSLNAEGRSNVHENGKGFRTHYFGNTMVYRYIKSRYPEAWIWDERYRFSFDTTFCRDKSILHAQAEFIRMLGANHIQEIRALAIRKGLNPETNNAGRPDLAVHFPKQKTPWRFIEIKIEENRDKLKEKQVDWLKLFAEYFGREASVELTLSKSYEENRITMP